MIDFIEKSLSQVFGRIKMHKKGFRYTYDVYFFTRESYRDFEENFLVLQSNI